jgi:hypothetical protein
MKTITKAEQTSLLRVAQKAFVRQYPGRHVAAQAFSDLTSPTLHQGDWLLIGVIGEQRALERVQYLACVNLVTGERKIVKGWQSAYALNSDRVAQSSNPVSAKSGGT